MVYLLAVCLYFQACNEVFLHNVKHSIIQLLHTSIFTKRCKHIMQIFFIDESISVLINHIESFLKLLNLSLIKHSKHIGSCPLCPLLGSLSFSLTAGHDDSSGMSVYLDEYNRGYIYIFFFRERSKFHFIEWTPSVIFSQVGQPRVKILPMVFMRWNKLRSFTAKKKNNNKYSVYFMLLILSGRSFIKIQYSSFPLFPVA